MARRTLRSGSAALGLLAAVVVAGCAGHPHQAARLAAGTPRAQVLAQAGPPTAEHALAAGGTRLVYSLQPLGQQAWVFDFDAAGRLAGARQTLNADDFARIETGRWTGADLLREFGPPARVEGVGDWAGPVWTWRWFNGGDMFFSAYLDAQGVVRRAHASMEWVDAPDRE